MIYALFYYNTKIRVLYTRVMRPHHTALVIILICAAVIITGLVVWSRTRPASLPIAASVLGQASLVDQTHFDSLTSRITTTPSVTRSPTPVPATPAPGASTIEVVSGSGELTEGDIVSFTWHIGGPAKKIRTTTIYYAETSVPGELADYVTPADARYPYYLKDFIEGEYAVPLRFVGSAYQLAPGRYYYRAYALIDGKHIWSGERTFVVKQLPKHEITVVNYPATVSSGANAAFTWDISGPDATTGFTAIVFGKQSKPGILDSSIDIPKTPYATLVSDFASGSYPVPQRFIGNATVQDPGVYYFRALTFINGKNIWSQEYSFTVQ